MPRLLVERGSEKGLTLSLDDPLSAVTVGRLQSCDLVLTDYRISRQHFRIQRQGARYLIEDLSSHNGTFVNGELITGQVELPFGTSIRAGNTIIAFQSGSVKARGTRAGHTIHGYRLLTRIGVGGMGEVYKAVQVSLGRMVALKILSTELISDRSFVERFMSEAQAAGKFNHPNVVQVHEAGMENGTYYFSMEYVEGGSVQDMIAQGNKIDPLRATEIVLQAARALEYAEKIGLVHCDIKPDNLMLTPSGDVRLSDLGIAKTLNKKGKVEQTDGVYGSPHYMAPEQARGLPMDHRSDLYSLGITYYRILLGKLPFTGKDAKEIMEKQVFDNPETSRKIDPSLAPMVHSILEKLLKKKSAERYRNATLLIKDLEVAADQTRAGVKGTSVTTGMGVSPYRFRRRMWRKK